MTYRAPLAEMEFCAAQIIGQDRLAETALFAEATPETRSAILDQAAKLCEGALVPVNRDVDRHAARLENGVVRCPPGFRQAYAAIAEGGRVGITGNPEHGGMGFIEETGAAQFARDVRVTAIYEGTNGIHAMDLVGRKLSVDGGAMARSMIAEIAATGAELNGAGAEFADIAVSVVAAAGIAEDATNWMLAATEPNDRAAGGTPYLRLMALTLGTRYLGRGALAARGTAGADRRLALARFFATQITPQVGALGQAATRGAAPLYALNAEALTA